jgi:hypothetical protein
MRFADRFDEILAKEGPAAVFTHTSDGELKVDLLRTRDAWQRVTGTPTRDDCHCLSRDHATGFVQYVFATSPELCTSPRADVTRFPSEEAALEAQRAR